jgi:hypothetical protein
VLAFWDTLFRRLARECKYAKPQVLRLTLRQALNLLDRGEEGGSSSSGPGIPVSTPQAMESYLRDYAERHGLDYDASMAEMGLT